MKPWYPPLKRVTDVVFAMSGLIITAPIWAIVSLAILILDGSPVLYRGPRLGKHALVFGMYKFRTMRVGADSIGPGITGAGDIRTTRVGHFLRTWKLDELPQLVNVLEGHMSLVGPRPEDPRYLPNYSERQREVFRVRPGITGPTQIMFRNEEKILTSSDVEEQYRSELLPMKLDLDLKYVETATLLTDMRLTLRTLRDIFRVERARTNSM